MKLRTSSSHEEGAERDFAVNTVSFEGEDGKVTALTCVRVDDKFQPIPGTEFKLRADLVFLAMGFVSPVQEGMVKISAPSLIRVAMSRRIRWPYKTSVDKVFACGDMRRGQSLVVWAIREGRQAAHSVDKHLMGTTILPR